MIRYSEFDISGLLFGPTACDVIELRWISFHLIDLYGFHGVDMRLHRAEDGHYYTRGYTGKFATLQVSAAALDYLKVRGIQAGGEIPRDVFLELHVSGGIFADGSGLPGVPVAIDIPERTMEALIEWGKQGQVDRLEGAVSEAGASVASCVILCTVRF